jgi:transcriptional regulator with GAF, ATPase, and Fis domain
MRRAEQILQRLHASAFLGGEVPIRFSLGAASCDAQERGVRRGLDLIRRANVALSAAKQAGGGRLATWQPGAEEQVGYLDRLTGIFTGQLSKDYRNMAVLSDTVSILAGHDDPHVLAVQVVKELHAAMKPERVGLFEWSDEGGLRLIYGLSGRVAGGSGEPGQGSHEGLLLHDDERLLLEATRTRRRAEERSGGEASEPTLSFAVPLLAGEKALGALYLAGRSGPLGLDSSDLVFLEALASQVALALDRARLSEQQRQHEEQERRRLRAEVDELRNALRRTQFLYRSGQMEALLDRVKRVAPTNATVLILGESGTGKEMVARAIHQLSPRRDQPFVVVDCGAIPTTLIESELFGHEKGAFTGAQQRQLGRLVQADKGTLLLDEIGELPLEAQSRLLRFVQERHVTPIGGRAGRAVDVRVLAATNRDLQKEVGAGRFRADLYHRLNVVRLEIPPLRARPDDILHLAHHFREAYSLLYGRGPFTFSPDAEALIVGHPWPGNVRELENRVMRAVILCQGPALTQADLGFAEDATGPLDGAPPAPFWAKDAGVPAEPPAGLEDPPGVPEAPPERVPTAPLSFAELRSALQREIQRALAAGEPVPPLGRWLADDLVLEADAAAAGVGSRAATILGMPETTLRRRVDRARAQAKAGWSLRSESWPGVRAALAELVRSEATGGGLFRETQRILFEEVVAKAPDDPRTAAALLGVTLPTFRRRSEAADALGSSEPG